MYCILYSLAPHFSGNKTLVLKDNYAGIQMKMLALGFHWNQRVGAGFPVKSKSWPRASIHLCTTVLSTFSIQANAYWKHLSKVWRHSLQFCTRFKVLKRTHLLNNIHTLPHPRPPSVKPVSRYFSDLLMQWMKSVRTYQKGRMSSTDSLSVFHGRKIKEVTHRYTCRDFNASKYDVHALILYHFQCSHLIMTEGQDRQGIFSHRKNQTLVYKNEMALLTVWCCHNSHRSYFFSSFNRNLVYMLGEGKTPTTPHP